MLYIYVGIAGGLGAICRYLLGHFINTNGVFPWATLCANLFGAFALAFISSNIKLPKRTTTAITTGFIGSFTTFSAVSVETVALVQTSHFALAALYVALSIGGGLLAIRVGKGRTQ